MLAAVSPDGVATLRSEDWANGSEPCVPTGLIFVTGTVSRGKLTAASRHGARTERRN